MLFLTKSKSKPVRITGKHEAGNKPTNSSSFKNQSGRHLSHFLKTPLSISLSFSLSLHHVAASPQMIGATEPCERLSEIGRWEMHEISKRMKIFQVFMFQRAKEVVLRHEARVILLSRLLVEMAWNTVYFTGRWVEWDQTSTDLLFTHSQLNTSHCNGAQGDEPALYITTLWNGCIYQGWVLCPLMMEFIVSMCAWGVTAVVASSRENNVCAVAGASQCVCICGLSQMVGFYSADFVIHFTSKIFFHRENLSLKQPAK